MVKPEETYAVYGTDADGSERKLTHVQAKSRGHAMSEARRLGYKKVTDAVVLRA